ncbi:Membrane protein involved in the export of O-antigen and teichoic acid [Verrucomicrobium sp. GAS474]|uniref:hypothetical protein n=1 Tax=Verrucomicrobium sp. GAS474 TaxID=1882831 RepID=UPI00087A45B9|nr:hypothetical protein [Verrucomicrobium sp. GAS474]SDU00706.1 Membrane protein involved in the export of O-antigen and teichoic acid [Verrucomicrobium sp. GAS474]
MSEPNAVGTHRRELFFNQLWQGLNFASKAGFLALLTPLMLKTWGGGGYGMFALSSSLLVSMAVLDGGVRSMTRLKLCEAIVAGDDRAFGLHIGRGLASFGLVALTAFLVAMAGGFAGIWSRALNLPPEGDFLIPATVGLVGLFMLSMLAMEPLAARGKLSALKAANTVGACAGIPVVALLLVLPVHLTVSAAVFAYLVCLIVPNFVLIVRSGLFGERLWRDWGTIRWGDVAATFRAGGWFYMTTIAWIVKTHALTFVVSAIGGPAAAGAFYILLRITEIVGNLGSTSGETALSALAREPQPEKRAESFRHTLLYAAVFCLHGALGVGFLTGAVLERWLPDFHVVAAIGWAMAAYGLAGAFGRITVNAAMGTGLIRMAAIGTIAEAVGVTLAGVLLQPRWGLPGLFAGGSLAALCMVPTAWALCANFGKGSPAGFFGTWVAPLGRLLPLLVVNGVVLFFAARWDTLPALAVAVAVTGGCVVVEIKRLHR